MSIKKAMAAAVAGILATTTVFGLVGCTTPDEGNGLDTEKVDTKRTQLYVYNYNGGFGSDWLASAKAKYEELHKDDELEPGTGKLGVQVIVQNEKTNMENNPEQTLSTKNELFFTEGAAYRALVAQYSDKFEDITSIVTGQNKYESGKTIESKLTDEQKAYFEIDGQYYGLPHYSGSYGIIYDKDMFEARKYYLKNGHETETGELAKHFAILPTDTRSPGPDGKLGTEDDGLPATYEEFYLLCDFIASRSDIPLIWTGKYRNQYLTNLMTSLVANHEGLEQMMLNYNLNGSATNLGKIEGGKFVKDENPTTITDSNGYELARQEGKYYGLEFIQKLSTTDKWYYNLSFNNSFSHTDAQRIFVSSISSGKRIAMLVEGSWWESEATQVFNDMVAQKGASYSKTGRNFGWMPLPHATKDKLGAPDTYNDVLYSLCFVKKGLSDLKKQLAMDFLQFITTDQALVEFTQITGAPKAYNYNMTDEQLTGVSPFARSHTKYRQGADVIYPFSSTPKFVNNLNYFRSMDSYHSNVNSQAYAPAYFHENTKVTAAAWFSGMYTYYQETWSSLK